MGRAMMAVVAIFFVVVLMAAGYAAYYFLIKDDDPIKEAVAYKNIFLRITDTHTDKQIQSGFLIYLPETNTVYKNGTTLKNGRLKIEVPFNTTIYLMSFNLEGQEYYTTIWNQGSTKILQDRDVNLNVDVYGEIEIEHNGTLNGDNIFIKLTKKGAVNSVKPCLRWSFNIISADIIGKGHSETPSRLNEKVDRCYDSIDISGNSSEPSVFEIRYTLFKQTTSEDFIKVYLIDEDARYWQLASSNGYVSEDKEGKDIGIPDVIYRIGGSD